MLKMCHDSDCFAAMHCGPCSCVLTAGRQDSFVRPVLPTYRRSRHSTCAQESK